MNRELVMNNNSKIPSAIKQLDLSGLIRIDYSIEGAWNDNLTVIWERDKGMLDYSSINRSHEIHKPAIELYFPGYWLGLHCYNEDQGKYIFDENYALRIIKYIEKQLN